MRNGLPLPPLLGTCRRNLRRSDSILASSAYQLLVQAIHQPRLLNFRPRGCVDAGWYLYVTLQISEQQGVATSLTRPKCR